MKRLNANRNQKLSLRLKGKEKDNIFTKGTSSAILAVKDIINTKPPKLLKKKKIDEEFFKLTKINSRRLRDGYEILADYNVNLRRTGPINSLEKIIKAVVKDMTTIEGKTYANARLQIYMDHPIFYSHNKYWWFSKSQETVSQLIRRLENILQSCETVSIEDVTFKTTVILNPTGTGGKALRVIDDVKKRSIIQISNNDTICLGRAVVTSISIQEELQKLYYPNLTVNQIKYVREGRKLQETLAKELYKNSNVQVKQNGNDLDDVKLIENYLKLQIIILNGNTDQNIIYSGSNYEPKIYLYFHDSHYNVITNICGFLACNKFCDKCLKSYSYQHSCHSTKFEQIVATIPEEERNKFPGLFKGCQDCLNQLEHKCNFWYCKKCDKINNVRYEKKDTHVCHQYKCFTCGAKVPPVDGIRDVNHKCYIQPNHKSKVGNKYVFFDFETDQSSGIHDVNYCIAAVWNPEQTYYILISPILCVRFLILKPDFAIKDITYEELLKVTQDKDSDIFWLQETYEFRESVINMFYQIFLNDTFYGYTFIAHYGKGFDFHPVVGIMLKQNLKPKEPIVNGNKINCLKVEKLSIRFIDSINFTLCPLRAFPSTFGVEGKKGHFPHYFNVKANQDYIGPYPDKKYYGYNTFTKKNKEDFDKWYSTTEGKKFNFQKEMFEYCFADVELLLRGCIVLRQSFLNLELNGTLIGEDPFQYITIAQLCTKIYRHMIPKNTIAITKNTTFADKQSKKAIQWLEFLAKKNNLTIQHARRGGEVLMPWYDQKTQKTYHWKFDGFDSTNNTVYEFYGCYFHGCPQCFPNRNQICNKSGRPKTMEEVYKGTLLREERIRLRYNLVTIWEHDFDANEKMKTFNIDSTLNKLRPRDAFYGGRTESVRPYHKFQDNEKGQYYDFVSLYPTVQNECKFPTGHPKTILPNSNSYNYDWFGLIKCKVLPPRGLYPPVLPYKQKTKGAHKLLFGLCKACMEGINRYNCKSKFCMACIYERNKPCSHASEERAITGTWTTIEVEKALEKGYQILEIFEVQHFENSSSELFKTYVKLFLKIKAESSGCPCKKDSCPNDCPEKLEYIRTYKDVYNIDLDTEKIVYNAGIRTISKICLNNLWGHFGMREEFSKTVYVSTLEEQVNIIYNDKYKEVSQIQLNDDWRLMQYKTKEEYRKPNKSTNIYIACFTTAHARLKLYGLLELLGERVLYMDTDSIIFIDDGSDECKKIQERLGACLGQLTNELGMNYITEFVAPAPKDYAYKLNDGTTKMKNKGIVCNAESERKITFEKKIELVKGQLRESIPIVNKLFVLDKKKNTISVKRQIKKYSMEFNKRMIPNGGNNNDTIISYPYGY